MDNIIWFVQEVASHALLICIGVAIGQWANLPTTEWDKLSNMPFGMAMARVTRWTYWSIRRFFSKYTRSYPFNN